MPPLLQRSLEWEEQLPGCAHCQPDSVTVNLWAGIPCHLSVTRYQDLQFTAERCCGLSWSVFISGSGFIGGGWNVSFHAMSAGRSPKSAQSHGGIGPRSLHSTETQALIWQREHIMKLLGHCLFSLALICNYIQCYTAAQLWFRIFSPLQLILWIIQLLHLCFSSVSGVTKVSGTFTLLASLSLIHDDLSWRFH